MTFQIGRQREQTDLLSITPMVDVVFNLLAFFMLATHLLSTERDFPMGYQESRAIQGAAAEDLPASVPVYLTRTGAGVGITVGGLRLADNDFGGLRRRLADINLPATTVVLEADPSLSVDQVAKALDAVLASPMKNVSLSRLNTTTAGNRPAG